jgi:hypothetical protein
LVDTSATGEREPCLAARLLLACGRYISQTPPAATGARVSGDLSPGQASEAVEFVLRAILVGASETE